MKNAFDAVEKSIAALEQLQKMLGKIKTAQVSSDAFRSNVKSAVRAWFDNSRKALQNHINQEHLRPIDAFYQALLEQSGRRTLRTKYKTALAELKKSLISLRSSHCLLGGNIEGNDAVPDFSTLIRDQDMRDILSRRWGECSFCIKSKQAPLSAVVMMGGMVEGLMLVKVLNLNEADKTKIFNAKASPKDKSGKSLNLKEWTLNNYIDVAHEIGWISQTAKDVSIILRDYRNYIHPHREYTEKVKLSPDDAVILWDVCKSISRQILSG